MLRCFIWSIETESKDKEKIIMLDGIMISAGIVFGIVARYFYAHSYDESCCGGEIDWCNLILSILFDCASVTLIVGSLGNYYGIIK